jgi:hypothetical protein
VQKGFLVSFDYTGDAEREISRFFHQTGKVIIPLTVQEILDEQIAHKLARTTSMFDLFLALAVAFAGSVLGTLLWMVAEVFGPLFLRGQLGAPLFRVGLFWVLFALLLAGWIVNLWRI